MDGWMDGWVGGWVGGWVDGWMDDIILHHFQQNLGHIRIMGG